MLHFGERHFTFIWGATLSLCFAAIKLDELNVNKKSYLPNVALLFVSLLRTKQWHALELEADAPQAKRSDMQITSAR